MSVVEYSQRRLAFFRDNRLIGEIKLYDLDLAGRVVDEYMTGGVHSDHVHFLGYDDGTVVPANRRRLCRSADWTEEEEDADAGSHESIAPFTLLGGILYLNEFELLPGLSADACRNIGRLRRKAVSAHLVGDRKTVVSCARQINRVVEADKRRRERLSSKKGRPTPKQKPAQKKKNTGPGYDAEYRRFREQFMRDVTDPKKIREADRLAFFSGTQIILEN